MLADERNFRSTYYEKVGCRSVEEKRSLELLLKDKPLHRIKFKQFCLLFTVPAVHRSLLWNLLLGVTSVFCDAHDYVMQQRLAVYEDLLHAMKTLRIIDEKTPKSQIFHAMWLLENKKLKTGFQINSESNFVNITEVLLQICDNDVEIYWIAKGFYVCSLEIANDFPKLKELTYSLLQKEDNTLYNHLVATKLLYSLPLEKWYALCFAGVIAKPALIRIWDKICGGSRKIVIFVFIVLLNFFRLKIIRSTDLNALLEHIDSIKDNHETADHIVNKSIDLWKQNKEHTEFMIHRNDN